ncbi:hypothetical protein TWF718_001251 [Orbilia javanica]|uniref:Uncharacterized protein n=1 Tax=Orbilia javanica TaxID=47235 RepID=A0AAN8N109_9PEZI
MPSLRSLVRAVVCASIAQTVIAAPNSTACNANNCLRALRRFGSTSYAKISTDCAGYSWATGTPSVVTVYETITATETLTTVAVATEAKTVVETSYQVVTETNSESTVIVAQSYPDPFKAGVTARAIAARDFTPGPIPTYASACTSGERYVSACSCYGIPVGVATILSTTTVLEHVTETTYITSSVFTTEEVAETVVEPTTTTVNVEYTSFAMAITSADEGFPYDKFGPNSSQTGVYVDMTFGRWEFWGDVGTSSIRQPDGRIYYPHLGTRWYHYCTSSYLVGSTGQYYSAPSGSMFVNSFDSASAGTPGQELSCNWGSDNVIHCSCTVDGVAYTKMTYHRNETHPVAEFTLRSGSLPATGEWQLYAKAITSEYCQDAGEDDEECWAWNNADGAIWTSWKSRRSLHRKI